MSKRERPTHQGNSFESLTGFKGTKEQSGLPEQKEVAPTSKDVEKPVLEQEPIPGVSELPSESVVDKIENPKPDKENNLSHEDEIGFNRIIQIINIDLQNRIPGGFSRHSLASKSGNSKRYFRIREFFRLSNKCDVEEYYNYHNLRHEASINPEIDATFKALLIRGYKSQAIGRIKSLTAEGLKYGSIPGKSNPSVQEKKDFRIAEAKKFAEKSGTTLEALVAQYKLEYLLHG